MFGNFGGILSQIQNMQSQLKELQVEVTVGDGNVVMAMNGSQELLSIKIAPELINVNEITKLEDVVAEGLNLVQLEARNKVQEHVSKITGINLANFTNMFQG